MQRDLPVPPTAITIPPPTSPPPYLPLPNLPAVPLDETHNGFGIAQHMARKRKLQARILWIDATANLERFNTSDKIADLVAHVKKAGFNTIVLDVKPIVGYTLYPSQFAPKLGQWKGRMLPLEFDPLPDFVAKSHAVGLQLIVSLNAFSEGHRDFKIGPGYEHPDWQTVLYEVKTQVHAAPPAEAVFPIADHPNRPPRGPQEIAVVNDFAKFVPDPAAVISLLNAAAKVVLQTDGAHFNAVSPTLLAQCSAFVGTGAAGDFLRQYARVGDTLALEATPDFVPISQRPEQQVPLMTNPNNPDVQKRLLEMLAEVVRGYDVDGVIFDDRLRYAGLNADFSDLTRRQFETYIGRPLHWPDDVYHIEYSFPSMLRRLLPGPYFDAWLTFRALTLRNFVAAAVATVKTIRPACSVGIYTGSWYGQYPDLGVNWAADDFTAGFRFLTPSYQQTGFAGLLDFLITGCYYETACVAQAVAAGRSPGATVEAAGQLSNRAANDQTWTYAGISLADFMRRPERLQEALQAALASTQGVMVFDLSYNMEQWWPVFEEAFQAPATAPQAVPGLLARLRKAHAAHKAAHAVDPPVIILNGVPGTGL